MKVFTVLVLSFLLASCAFTSYTKEDTKVTHFRVFTTADSTEAKIGDANVKINGQKIDAEALGKALGVLISAIAPVPIPK
jgi:hypothetical protein